MGGKNDEPEKAAPAGTTKNEAAEKAGDIPTKQLIVQIAARALRKVHYEHQVFSLGYAAADVASFRKLNVGEGVELALETTVAAAIVQEFHASKVAQGWLNTKKAGDGGEDGQRFYRIEHEVAYRLKGADESKPEAVDHIDVVIWRTTDKGDAFRKNEKTGKIEKWGILPIELKRARLAAKDMSSGNAEAGGRNRPAVSDDIVKLAAFCKEWAARELKSHGLPKSPGENESHKAAPEVGTDVYPHVLVWGTDHDDPHKFFDDAFHADQVENVGAGHRVIEWVPLSWANDSDGKAAPAKIERWLWVAYQELATTVAEARRVTKEERAERAARAAALKAAK